jgi:hypothetical protein
VQTKLRSRSSKFAAVACCSFYRVFVSVCVCCLMLCCLDDRRCCDVFQNFKIRRWN